MVNCFIEIRKSDLKTKLKSLKVRDKYQNQICDGVKEIIEQSLDDFILQSLEQNRIIEGIELQKGQQNL